MPMMARIKCEDVRAERHSDVCWKGTSGRSLAAVVVQPGGAALERFANAVATGLLELPGYVPAITLYRKMSNIQHD